MNFAMAQAASLQMWSRSCRAEPDSTKPLNAPAVAIRPRELELIGRGHRRGTRRRSNIRQIGHELILQDVKSVRERGEGSDSALATSPKLMLLDEPMAGMGPDESERMVQLLQSLRGDTTLLLVEHDMDAVFRLADTISVLVSGQVIACGTAEQIKNDAAVKRAYLGDE